MSSLDVAVKITRLRESDTTQTARLSCSLETWFGSDLVLCGELDGTVKMK